MVRKVRGFLAKDGTYFDNPDECELYEASLDLNALFRQTVSDWGYTGQGIDSGAERLILLVRENREQFARYVHALKQVQPIATKEVVPKPNPAGDDGLDGQSTEST